MTQSPPIPTIFDKTQWQETKQFISRLNKNQALWLSGYLAASSADHAKANSVATSSQGQKILIAFGTETNNCRHLAEQLAKQCQQAGIAAETADLSSVRLRKLSKLQTLIVITATHGDGDPPEPITEFYESLMADDAPQFKNLHFAVLALGDSTYEHFCVTGIYIDERLEALGGSRLIDRQDCDVDFEAPAEKWMEQLLSALPKTSAQTLNQQTTESSDEFITAESTTEAQYSKDNPVTVEVLSNQNLSNPTRLKPTHHIELSLDADDFAVEPGDAIGVFTDNPPELVALLLDATGLSAEQPVTLKNKAVSLVEALCQHCDLTVPSKNLLTLWAELTGDKTLNAIVNGDTKTQRHYLRNNQVRDVLMNFPARPEAQPFVDALRPLQPRLYDVANCLSVTEDELHLTVKAFSYPFNKRSEAGIASNFLLNLQPGDTLQVYPHRNARFHLPTQNDAPIILISEGTGIAPYRAFLQSLATLDNPPPCWFVFAEEHFEDDFLYQLDVQQAYQKGVLTYVDSVFYKDPRSEGLSLSSPIINNGKRLLDWLTKGAHIYFCGDKTSLENCEAQLQTYVDEQNSDTHWKRLTKNKRIHRNLY